MQYAQQIDAALGFKVHPDKLEAFATISSDHSRLANFQDCIGPVKTTFKLLGITYFVASRAQCSQDTVIRDTVVHRARKIRVVTKNLQLRKTASKPSGYFHFQVDGTVAKISYKNLA